MEKKSAAQSPRLRPIRGVTTLSPGLAACAVATAIALTANYFLPTVSPLLLGILCGALFANAVRVPQCIRPGLQFSSKRLLRLGVALLGLQVMFTDIIGLGWGMLAVAVGVVCLGIAGTMLVGKLLGLSWTQRLLIACGFSICGAAAVAAASGVVRSKDREVVTAVVLVVIFGTLMIPAIPMLSSLIELSNTEAGLWAGGSIHEVAQVVAAGGVIGGAALSVAVLIKLARVLMLAPVMAALSLRQRFSTDTVAGQGRPPLIPLFVLGFLACAGLRSTGALPDDALSAVSVLQTALLTAAMFALGADLRVSALRQVGARPFILGAISTVWVAGLALAGILLVS
ncbi:putative sulfate exporter family transporter [Hoyosella sp. YIM 151337]|uniref:YeiH family protein n=1 Tax=Hoyosella sp. YIM 151337 TaxID=2992742 RepID=UPI0022366D64|nr:putative sulfate exporter family transporter [Hoyosella sp. YIM 151337]MCW4353040.1 putative sulfate exporter family transporter [Hoyosella sp. YIM 151337]